MSESSLSLRAFLVPELVRFVAWLLAIEVVVGVILGHPWLGIVATLSVFLMMQWRSLYRLHRWLGQGATGELPELTGLWELIVAHIDRSQRAEAQAQDALKGIITRARTSVSALEEAIVLLDGETLEWWNPAAERLLGLNPRDIGQNIMTRIRHPDFQQFMYATGAREPLVLPSRLHQNQYVQIELTEFGHNDRLLIAYDVTRLHQLERMRKDFVANLSHEMRTPLTVIMGYLESLSDQEGIPPRLQRIYRQMQQQSQRMNALVDDLLTLSRLENTEQASVAAEVDMVALLHRLFDQAQAFNRDHDHSLELHLDSTQRVWGHESDLASAFLNLLTNAIKYTPQGGTIRLRWFDREDGSAELEVGDSGLGIAEQHLARLTERFYRVDQGRGRETGGTGLGLAIVKHVMLRHDGQLHIDSVQAPAPNHGSQFRCTFPPERLRSAA